MVPQAIKNISGQARRLQAVRDYAKRRMSTGDNLFVTEMLMEDEPDRTYLNMAVDGHVLNGSSPMVDTGYLIPMPTVRLMAIEESQSRIWHKERSQERVPGTEIMKPTTRRIDYGFDAVVPHHVARDVLYKDGWPFKQKRTNGNGKVGNIIEVAWLEAEVTKADCSPDVLAIYEQVKHRIAKGKAAPEKSVDDLQKKGKALS